MKKVELVEAVAEKTGLTKADTTRAIDATFATIVEALSKGDKGSLLSVSIKNPNNVGTQALSVHLASTLSKA